ncbi:MAG: hypothetical protein ABFD92_01045 [Planctomycetaceae bacterium]|nr:hypothetical protein [Planctomycetaceae bacterium]
MKNLPTWLMTAALLAAAGPADAQQRPAEKGNLYVPYRDIAAALDPAAKSILMDRGEFAALLAAAKANQAAADSQQLGQVTSARYQADVTGQSLRLTGELEVISLSDKGVAVPLAFARLGLLKVALDGKSAPLGYDDGALVLLVAGKGKHAVTIEASAALTELPLARFPAGGLQFGISIPPAVAGTMTLTAPGDLEISASAAMDKPTYDRAADRTRAELTIGGRDSVTAVLLGNGRQEAQKPILLGESTASVEIEADSQTLHCLYMVDVLRRSVRELQFAVDASWTITAVTCPGLVRWSVEAGQDGSNILTVRLGSASRGLQALHIKATAVEKIAGQWRSPRVILQDAAFQRGYLLVNTQRDLRVRGHELSDARREDAGATQVPALFGLLTGRLYYHWGADWSVKLRTAKVPLRRESQDRQRLAVGDKSLTLTGEFQVTAVGSEMFDMNFRLPPGAWELVSVTVNGSGEGFEYHVTDDAAPATQPAASAPAAFRRLRIELARPVQPEGVANVVITLQHVPQNWLWRAGSTPRVIAMPLLSCQADQVSGVVSVSTSDDLDAAPDAVPDAIKGVNVGRMTSMGLGSDVQLAWTYDQQPPPADVRLQISRRSARLSAESVGLVSLTSEHLRAHWRVTYTITRARTAELMVLVDKSLGEEVSIEVPGRRIASKTRVLPIELPDLDKDVLVTTQKAVPLENLEPLPVLPQAKGYDLWKLTLDAEAVGQVAVDVSYSRPLPAKDFTLPLVRPFGADQVTEYLALQAAEELAVDAKANAAGRAIDSADLPPLPEDANRLLAAWRFDSGSEQPVVNVSTTVHQTVAIPAALAGSAELTTYLDGQGNQRTQALFRLVNAGMQFASVQLPANATLWSITVDGAVAKPQRDTAGNYMVHLPRDSRSPLIKVVYGAAGTGGSMHALARATLPGVKVNTVSWTVVTAPGLRITAQDSDMTSDGLYSVAPAYQQTFDLAFGPREPSLDAIAYSAPPAAAARAVATESLHGGLTRKDAAPATQPAEVKSKVSLDHSRGLVVSGKYTLPVELAQTGDYGHRVTFTSLDPLPLAVELTDESGLDSFALLGFVMAGLAGLMRLNARAWHKARFIIAVLIAASLVAVWWRDAAPFMNGMFWAALLLIPFYLAVGLVRIILRAMRRTAIPVLQRAAVLLAAVLLMAQSARAADAQANNAPPQAGEPGAAPLIIPYEGDPAKADQAKKVLVSYAKFIELWNAAHPDQAIDIAPAAGKLWLADVRYAATVKADTLTLTLTAQAQTTGKGLVVVPIPFEGVALTGASLDDKPVPIASAEKGMVLTLEGGAKGTLRLTAVTTAKPQAGRPTVNLTLPPLPAGVMTVALPADDLVLEVPQAQGSLTSRKTDGGVEWTVPLGLARALTLRWSPKAGGGTVDRTLSAAANHDVSFNHWGIVGATQMVFTFSATDYDQFRLLVPAGVSVTSLTGANLRDFAVVATSKTEGQDYSVVLVRLHRPATKTYEMTAKWVAPLPTLDKPFTLPLPQAGDVARESGAATLRVAGGMTLTEIGVEGGRRRASAAGGRDAQTAADATREVSSYYWPYRPFALTLKLHRAETETAAVVNQLVRIDARRCQLLVQANLTARRGRLFEASFALPDGYELLSAAGAAVEDFHVEPAPTGRRLYVNLRGGAASTSLALVLVKAPLELGRLSVPKVTLLDAGGAPLAEQTGRLAVQLADSLEAHTLNSENLGSAPPASVLTGWLASQDIRATQFAYQYDRPAIALDLDVRAKPTRTRVEIVAGVTVQPTAAWYTYRLRYAISGSPIDHVSFTLPTQYAALAAVTCPAMRSVKTEDADGGRTRWTVSLINEVTGVLDVAVNFAVPISQQTTALAVPRVVTAAPEGYRCVVAVQNLSRHELSLDTAAEMTALPASQQRDLLGAAHASLQYVFQAFSDTWTLALKLKPAEPAKRTTAIIDLMTVATTIDLAGNSRYEVELMLQNRSEQFLHVKVPPELTLWSAYVDGKAVKPASADHYVSANDKGEPVVENVLIPLIKTSATGLPYSVKLYLAGRASEPLGRITKITPPAIRIIGIPVEQTTWSLQLPRGYRYSEGVGMARKGAIGDQEQQAKRAEAYRLLSRVAARGKQTKRLLDADEYSSAGNGTGLNSWTDNIRLQNDKWNKSREEARQFIVENRETLGGEAQRLEQTLTDDSNTQYGLNTVWQQRQEQAAAVTGVNNFLNGSVNNAGVSDAAANEWLDRSTEFVIRANDEQQRRIAGELEKNDAGGNKIVEQALGRKLQEQRKVGGRAGVDDEKKEEALKELTKQLEDEGRRNFVKQRDQLRQQQDELQFNRLTRSQSDGKDLAKKPGGKGTGKGEMYQSQRAAESPPALPGQPQSSEESWTYDGRGRASGGAAEPLALGVRGPVAGQPGGGPVPADRPASERGGDAIPAQAAVALGTFSLPVSLPRADGVSMDFAGSGGDVSVTIWAVKDSTARAWESTAAAVILLVLLALAVRIWRHVWRIGSPAAATQRIVLYAILALAGWVLWGLVPAVVLTATAAALAEAARYLPQRRAKQL